MLTETQLSYDVADGARILPRWLSSRDEAWLRAFAEEMQACAGLTVDEMEDRLRDVGMTLAMRHGRAPRVAAGVWQVERSRWRAIMDASVDPVLARAFTFELAARMPREDALRIAGEHFALHTEALLRTLFADRPGIRTRIAPTEPRSAAELVDAYNLALAQSLLVRSTAVVITVTEHARRVIGYAKLRGLLATFDETDDKQLRIRLDGPLALFRATTKYGRALADVLSTLATTVDFRLEANIVLRGLAYRLQLDPSAPLPRVHRLSRRTDSAVEARLLRDLQRIGPPWAVKREAAAVKVGRRLFFPDFTLEHPNGSILVEVVGFWTEDYLDAKVRALAALERPLIACGRSTRTPGCTGLAGNRLRSAFQAVGRCARADRAGGEAARSGSVDRSIVA